MNIFYIKKKFYGFIFFILFLISNNTISNANKVFIVTKIDNQVITNVDIEREYRYLIALNSNLEELPRKKIIQIAKKSIIKEKIKTIEIKKAFKNTGDTEYSNKVFKDFYKGLGLKNKNDFANYLSKYQLTVDDVKEKIKIETLWNELIFTMYRDQIKIDKDKLRKKLAKDIKKQKKNNSYLLYEIIFNSKNKKDLLEKFENIKKSIEDVGFENTANVFSESNTSLNNGKLGWINENQLSKKIQGELNKIKVGSYTQLITVPNGSLILMIKEKKQVEKKLDFENELNKLIVFERNRQLNQFSTIFFNKIRNNVTFNE